MTSSDEETDRALTTDLAALRTALHEVRAPADGEVALRAALWARRQRRAPAGAARRSRVPTALAAAAAIAAVAIVSLLLLRNVPDEGSSATDAPAPGSALPTTASGTNALAAFQPLALTPALSASQSYSVVRVRIPITALAPGNAGPPGATIEADLLVGEDGLARAIRFDSADTLFLTARSD